MGFAGLKFSGSPRMNGVFIDKIIKIAMIKQGVNLSFHENSGWNIILSLLLFVPRGLVDPFSCKVRI